MINRFLKDISFHNNLGRQMRFIAGPRQVGKTTLAKQFLEKNDCKKLYFNWDLRKVRDQYRKDPYFFETLLYDSKKGKKLPWACFDEIHKMPKWKNILKDYFDRFENDGRFVVTGSARLDRFRHSGDSLAGRYFLFKLFPLTLSEVKGANLIEPGKSAINFIEKKLSSVEYNQDGLMQLLNFSGFPEPFLKANKRFHYKWQQDILDRVVREDLRDLTRISDVENIATLATMLPSKIGSLLSVNSLKEDINVSYNAVKNYLSALELGYIMFFIPPYTKQIVRSIKKEKKCYFYDWSRCETESKRFENYVAVELTSLIEYWNDSGIDTFKLHFIRTKDGKETDFLITKSSKPWILFEVKMSDSSINSHNLKHSEFLGNIPLIQICMNDKVLKKNKNIFRISASRFF